jgi:hypothetical protein
MVLYSTVKPRRKNLFKAVLHPYWTLFIQPSDSEDIQKQPTNSILYNQRNPTGNARTSPVPI